MKRWVTRIICGLVLPIIIVSLAGLVARDNHYVIDLPPPTGRETYAQVMPASIGNEPMELQPLLLDSARFHGARAQYGQGASIEIVRVVSVDAMDAYVIDHLKPRMAIFQTRASGKFDGRWRLRASGDAGRLYGWQNQNWLFVIEAANDRLFDEIVDRFAYISRD